MSLLVLNDLINVCHLIAKVALDLLLFGPVHFRLICAWPWTTLMQPRLIIEVIASFGFILPRFLSFLDLGVLSLLDLLQGVDVDLLDVVALDAVVGGFVHLVVDLTRADWLGHGEKARGYFYYFIFYLGLVGYMLRS